MMLPQNHQQMYHAIIKTYNLHPKFSRYVSDWLIDYRPSDFSRLYRMTQGTFHKLHGFVMEKYPQYECDNDTGRILIASMVKLLVTLEYLAAQGPLRRIEDEFGLADSTVLNIIEEILDIFTDNQGIFIKWPSVDEAEIIKSEFEDASTFPGVIGAIDGSQIEVKVPIAHIHDCTNRKCRQSVILQGVCTYSKLFSS
ncbi:unnamed protein product [Bemisia tabaci]|uniref:Nuclease HARBI1 n=1 Tax=Bemisia tabaci TaxID=7038 RepID=A0A9P0A752_BEMTA|nr:unnamed protein product [Bemisia tabaci]